MSTLQIIILCFIGYIFLGGIVYGLIKTFTKPGIVGYHDGKISYRDDDSIDRGALVSGLLWPLTLIKVIFTLIYAMIYFSVAGIKKLFK